MTIREAIKLVRLESCTLPLPCEGPISDVKGSREHPRIVRSSPPYYRIKTVIYCRYRWNTESRTASMTRTSKRSWPIKSPPYEALGYILDWEGKLRPHQSNRQSGASSMIPPSNTLGGQAASTTWPVWRSRAAYTNFRNTTNNSVPSSANSKEG